MLLFGESGGPGTMNPCEVRAEDEDVLAFIKVRAVDIHDNQSPLSNLS